MDLERKYNFINQRIVRAKKEIPVFLFTSIFVIFLFFSIFIFGLLISLYYLQPNNFFSLLLLRNINISGNAGLTTGGIYNREGNDIFTAVTFFIIVGFVGLKYSVKSFFGNICCWFLLKYKKYDFNLDSQEMGLVISFLNELPISESQLEEKKINDPVKEKIIYILFLINFINKKNRQINQIDGFELLTE